ncbi:hypothetical protein KAR34_13520 [bacterium]|nr:hypothetical protein [bacterium]
MERKLIVWEQDFERSFQASTPSDWRKAGGILSLIPNRADWDCFIETVKKDWDNWKVNLLQYKNCLIILYDGLAFYEYGENRFWPQFAKTLGKEVLPSNLINEINKKFAKAAKNHGLKILQRNNRMDFNGSAVYHIGIPLSLWDGFLDICEWALWRNNWKLLLDDEWEKTITKLAGSRVRLRIFLIENREAASMLIQEVIDARKILTEDQKLSISDISQATTLRIEYFEEVPETAEFLRLDNLESLYRGRAILTWNDQRGIISLYLPAIDKDKLPATWCVDTLKQEASTTPDEFILNSLSFESLLKLKLESSLFTEVIKLRGIKPWGMFEARCGGNFVNSDREQLPYRSYVIISQEKIENITREGFEEKENPINEHFELADGKTCFVTRLWPNDKHGVLRIKQKQLDKETTIRFRANTKIEAKIYPGIGNRAANFTRYPSENKIVTDQLPTVCVAIPYGYEYSESYLNDKFSIFVDKLPAIGKWKKYPVHSDEKNFYRWIWDKKPFREQTKTGVKLRGFKQLNECYKAPDLKGDRTFFIRSPEFVKSYRVYLEHTKYSMTDCWENLPGAYLIWFLLCQEPTGSKLEDLLLAKDIIAPEARQLSTYLLHKYANFGFLIQRGRLWEIAKSHAAITCHTDRFCQLDYCGDPSILWGLYRKMYHESPNHELPVIEVINKWGAQEVPFLQMKWNIALQDKLIKYLQSRDVMTGGALWTH